MIGHKICFNSEILIIIPKLSLLPLLIRSTGGVLPVSAMSELNTKT